MTICDLCLKENRPLCNYEIIMLSQWPAEKIAVTKDSVLLCAECKDKIVNTRIFNFIKAILAPPTYKENI